jgi:thioesterase domain-containing protein
MKQYTIQQAYFKFIELKTKAHKKKSWNHEATSYEINIQRISHASHLKLVTEPTLSDNDKAMLLAMSIGEV